MDANMDSSSGCYDVSLKKPVPKPRRRIQSAYETPAEWTNLQAGFVENAVGTINSRRVTRQSSTAQIKEDRTEANASLSMSTTQSQPTTICGDLAAGVINFGRINVGEMRAQTRDSQNTLQRNTRIESSVQSVNEVTRDKTAYDIRGNFVRNLNVVDEIYDPEYATVLLKPFAQPCPETMSMTKFHEPLLGSSSSLVMLLGRPGAGKSITAKRYAQLALNGEIDALTDIKMVHFVSGEGLNLNSKCRPFELLFARQLGGVNLDPNALKALEVWISCNPKKVLLVLDGLDKLKLDIEGSTGNIDLSTKELPLTIIRNLLRGNIYKNMPILATSRWHWILSIPADDLPAIGVHVKGLQRIAINQLLLKLVGIEKQVLTNDILLLHPAVIEMCSNPLFLVCLANVISNELFLRREDEFSEAFVVLSVLLCWKSSQSSVPWSTAALNAATDIAYDAMQNKVLKVNYEKVRRCSDYDSAEMEHFLDVTLDPSRFNCASAITSYSLSYRLQNEALRDCLAAMHILREDCPAFKIKVKDVGERENMIFCAAIDESMKEKLQLFTDGVYKEFDYKRKYLRKQLCSRITPIQKDIGTLLLMYECKAFFLSEQKRILSELKIGEVKEPGKSHKVLSLMTMFPQAKRFKAASMSIKSSTLSLLVQVSTSKCCVEIDALTVLDKMDVSNLKELWNLIESKTIVKNIQLETYGICYSTTDRRFTVNVLQLDAVKLLRELVELSPKRPFVVIAASLYQCSNDPEEQLRDLNELEQLGGVCHLKLLALQTTNMEDDTVTAIAGMLNGESECQIATLRILDSTGELQLEVLSSKKKDLIIKGRLTDSDVIVNLIDKGGWCGLISSDFKIDLQRDDKSLKAEEKQLNTSRGSHATLCRFMTKLRCTSLSCGGITVHADYGSNYSCHQLVFTTNGKEFSKLDGYFSYIMKSEACYIHINQLELSKHSDQTSKVQLSITKLDWETLPLLEYLTSVASIQSLKIETCNLRSVRDVYKLCDIAEVYTVMINDLKVFGDICTLAAAVHRLCTLADVATAEVGSDKEILRISNEGGIRIDNTLPERLFNLVENFPPELQDGVKILILQLDVMSSNKMDKVCSVAQRGQDGDGIMIQIDTIIYRNQYDETFKKNVFRLAKLTQIRSIKTADIGMELDYYHDNEVHQVIVSKVNLNNFNTLTSSLKDSVQFISVRHLSVDGKNDDEVRRSLEWLVTRLQQQQNCTVENLYLEVQVTFLLPAIIKLVRSCRIRTVASETTDNDGKFKMQLEQKERDENTFNLLISRINASKLQDFAQRIGNSIAEVQFNIQVETCEIGTGNESEILEQIASMEKIDDNLQRALMECAKTELRKRIDCGLRQLNIFCSSHSSHVKISSIQVLGDITDVSYVLQTMKNALISSAHSSNMTIDIEKRQEHDNKVMIEIRRANTEEFSDLAPLLRNGVAVRIKQLCLGDLSKKEDRELLSQADGILQQDSITAEVVETTAELHLVVENVIPVISHLNPPLIRTSEYEISLRCNQEQRILQIRQKTTECHPASFRALELLCETVGVEPSSGMYFKNDGSTKYNSEISCRNSDYMNDTTETSYYCMSEEPGMVGCGNTQCANDAKDMCVDSTNYETISYGTTDDYYEEESIIPTDAWTTGSSGYEDVNSAEEYDAYDA